jgi:integrase/recombinase XerD
MGNILRKYITKNNRKDRDFLFLKKSKTRYSRKDVDALLKEYLKLAKLPSINVHAFRHTFATFMADQGADKLIISQLLGHESLSATESYINPHYVRNRNLKMPENDMVIEFLKSKI